MKFGCRRRLAALAAAGAILGLSAACSDDDVVATRGPTSSSTSSATTAGSAATEPSTTTTREGEASTQSPMSTTLQPADPDPGLPLMGRTFTAVAGFDGAVQHEFLEEAIVSIAFERRDDGDVVRWSGGCNAVGGSVVVEGDRLLVGDDLAGSTVGCTLEAQAQDEWVSRVVTSDPLWELAGDQLTLDSGSSRLVLAAA